MILTAAAWAEDIPVRLSDWEISDPATIRVGQITCEKGGGSYVSLLLGEPTSASPQGPAYFPLVVANKATFASSESQASLDGQGRLHFSRASGAFCGLWLRWPAADARNRQLALWVRGRGRMTVKVADPAWVVREDAVEVADCQLLEQWQLIRVDPPQSIDASQLVSLSFLGHGEGVLEVGPLGLVPRHQASAPPPQNGPATREVNRGPGNAVWIWDTVQRLESRDRQWIDFLRDQGVTTVFLQIPDSLDERLAQLTGELRSKGLQVQALTGDRHDILAEARPRVMARLDNLFEQQRRLPEGQRLQGVHFDVEPYLLPGFSGSRRRAILELYIELVESLVSRCHAAGLKAGFDIPSWFDQPPPYGPGDGRLEVGGAVKFPYQHVLDRADEVAVMSYRTRADRVLECAFNEMEYARSLGKSLWLGLETSPLPDETSYTFEGAPRRGRPGPNEVVFAGDHFTMGPSSQEGLCWTLSAPAASPASNLSFHGLPARDFEAVRQQLESRGLLAFHHLKSWLELRSR